jgi:hypothetical protein
MLGMGHPFNVTRSVEALWKQADANCRVIRSEGAQWQSIKNK